MSLIKEYILSLKLASTLCGCLQFKVFKPDGHLLKTAICVCNLGRKHMLVNPRQTSIHSVVETLNMMARYVPETISHDFLREADVVIDIGGLVLAEHWIGVL